MSTRRVLAVPLGVIAAVLLFLLVNPWVTPEPGGTLNQLVTAGFWVSFLALLVVLFQMRKEPGGETIEIEGPAFTRFLFGNSRAGLFWLPIRLFVGFSWLEAGYHKFSGTGWMDGGAALKGFWEKAVAVPDTGSPAITYDWYRSFIQFLLDNNAYTWFAPLITFGEMAVGLGLLVGCLTGIAAFFGALMNMSLPARGLGLAPTRSCSRWRSGSCSPGRSPATTGWTATSCRSSGRHGTRARWPLSGRVMSRQRDARLPRDPSAVRSRRPGGGSMSGPRSRGRAHPHMSLIGRCDAPGEVRLERAHPRTRLL